MKNCNLYLLQIVKKEKIITPKHQQMHLKPMFQDLLVYHFKDAFYQVNCFEFAFVYLTDSQANSKVIICHRNMIINCNVVEAQQPSGLFGRLVIQRSAVQIRICHMYKFKSNCMCVLLMKYRSQKVIIKMTYTKKDQH